MQFLNKVQKIHEKKKYTHSDIINSVSNIMKYQDRGIYFEEMAGQAIGLEFYKDSDGKIKAKNIKTGGITIIDSNVLPQNIIDILLKYFAANQDPIDVLLNTQGKVIRINPEVDTDLNTDNAVKTAISKSNLWRVKNDPVNNKTQAATPQQQQQQQQQQQAINENEENKGESFDRDSFSDSVCDLLLMLKNDKITMQEVKDIFEQALDLFADESVGDTNDDEEDKYNTAYKEGINLLRKITNIK